MSTGIAPTQATLHSLEAHRRGDGRFGEQPRAEANDLDVDDLAPAQCLLCGSPIDYCQGHGRWNSYDEVKACEVEPDDRVWVDGRDRGPVSAVFIGEDTVSIHFVDDTEAVVASEATVPVVSSEDFDDDGYVGDADTRGPWSAVPVSDDTCQVRNWTRCGDCSMIVTDGATCSYCDTYFSADAEVARGKFFAGHRAAEDAAYRLRADAPALKDLSQTGLTNTTCDEVAKSLHASVAECPDRREVALWARRRLGSCGSCGRHWDFDSHPTPSALCPFCNGDTEAARPNEVSDRNFLHLIAIIQEGK